MSLAFALMAAINGSTGSCATLSHGLERPHQASPASARRQRRFSPLKGGAARGPPGTLLHKPVRWPLFDDGGRDRLKCGSIEGAIPVPWFRALFNRSTNRYPSDQLMQQVPEWFVPQPIAGVARMPCPV
jgi:hypothetical protein